MKSRERFTHFQKKPISLLDKNEQFVNLAKN